VKSPNSDWPPEKGGFELDTDFQNISFEISLGENIMIDAKSLSLEHEQLLRAKIDEAGLAENVLWWDTNG
jgi:hypothetical protein